MVHEGNPKIPWDGCWQCWTAPAVTWLIAMTTIVFRSGKHRWCHCGDVNPMLILPWVCENFTVKFTMSIVDGCIVYMYVVGCLNCHELGWSFFPFLHKCMHACNTLTYLWIEVSSKWYKQSYGCNLRIIAQVTGNLCLLWVQFFPNFMIIDVITY